MSCLLVPTLAMDPWLFTHLDSTIDHPFDHKIVVSNGKNCDSWSFPYISWIVLNNGMNHGVAASWNLAPKMCPEANWWLIVNDDVWFHPGQLRTICQAADANWKEKHVIFGDKAFE